jgi:hypothetical protein
LVVRAATIFLPGFGVLENDNNSGAKAPNYGGENGKSNAMVFDINIPSV